MFELGGGGVEGGIQECPNLKCTIVLFLCLQAIFVMSTINYAELDYKRPKGVYQYPQWAVAVGWSMAAFAAMWIPLGWLYHIVRYGRDWDVSILLTLSQADTYPVGR